jgi:hypothetical protein
MDGVVKSIGIKLDTTAGQELELKELFEAFRLGINWSLKEIEKKYQFFLQNYKEIPRDHQTEGKCANCTELHRLSYFDKPGKQLCMSCARRCFSEYTVRKEVYGVGERVVEVDLKTITELPNKTHYTMLFSQAYAIWNSYNSWRNKRIREKQLLLNYLNDLTGEKRLYLQAARMIERNAETIKTGSPKLTWKLAKAQAFKAVYSLYPETVHDEISSMQDKLMELRRLTRPIHFPELETCRTVMLSSHFVEWKEEKLFITMFHRGAQELKYFGKEYLNTLLRGRKDSIIKAMETDNKAYCNLTKKGDSYFLMYPLTLEVKKPIDINECDPFVFMTSPTNTAIMGYDKDGTLQSVKWFRTGKLAFAKRHFKEKRAEIVSRKFMEEKMRKIRRRKRRVRVMGSIEARTVSTFNHNLSREMIDYIMGQSENPKILIWDIGNGVTQNFGRSLNYLKNLWPAVQQQEYLKHKAMQMSIPVVETKYNKCNDLKCSSCEVMQTNGNEKKKKAMKVVTQLIKGVKNFKCQECGYEVNMLINQANNIANTT